MKRCHVLIERNRRALWRSNIFIFSCICRFVNTDDPEAHTQNIECRHRWLKKSIKSLRTDRSLQSYTCTYVYRTRFSGTTTSGDTTTFVIDPQDLAEAGTSGLTYATSGTG
ncbi:uncharacterized protein LOC111629576 [Centruroides sculpturatus]|uniref:uncharacterized protein LOC111629576 n=1 Tax=Centruroides sculpturatus TaxID=218467 RepID=UPI000C6E8743|nr:uncharacterized protein LOC111629576 [Centruroides sculpturatus]